MSNKKEKKNTRGQDFHEIVFHGAVASALVGGSYYMAPKAPVEPTAVGVRAAQSTASAKSSKKVAVQPTMAASAGSNRENVAPAAALPASAASEPDEKTSVPESGASAPDFRVKATGVTVQPLVVIPKSISFS